MGSSSGRASWRDRAAAARSAFDVTIVARRSPGVAAITGAWKVAPAGPVNIGRLRSEASSAALCGASPIPISTGRTDRHRRNYGGDRDANRALHMIAVCRLRYCQRTRAYADRRTAEGKTKTEIIRCLKRYIARELYHALLADRIAPTGSPRHSDPIGPAPAVPARSAEPSALDI